jgi:hypothetical protein
MYRLWINVLIRQKPWQCSEKFIIVVKTHRTQQHNQKIMIHGKKRAVKI